MFSYRHAFHAGNHADVLKHTVLLAVLRHLTQKDTAFTVFDTHAGAGLAPPPGTPERAQFYKWLMWLSNTLQAEMPLYFYSDRWADTPEGAAALKRHA